MLFLAKELKMKPKKFLSFVLFITLALSSFGQVLKPVHWDFSLEPLGAGEYDLVFTASIDDTWHLYAPDIPPGGPIPTSFNYTGSENFEVVGEIRELSEAKEVYDNSFDMNLRLYSNEAVFKQKIKVLTDQPFTIDGFVEFMSCDDERCLPPDEEEFSFSMNTVAGQDTPSQVGSVDVSDGGSAGGGSGLLGFFLIAMLTGFAGILTPCVFPMIPMTVAFFSQGAGSRTKAIIKAFIFGLSIILIYSSIGIIVSLTSAGANFANNLSTHWIPNTIFFLLFMVFAASFLGMFELVMPSGLVNRADRQADRGGYLAAFFMGLTTVLVSFSCTGPIVGALLVEAASGDVIKPTIGMFGFGLAFGLPFTLLAIFPSWLSKMPKSGGWLNAVKVVLGFIVLAFGMKFLLTIDASYHLGIFSREIYLAIWIVLFTLMGFYLLGKIKFAHDSDLTHISVPRLALVIITFTFVLYLIPGLFGAPLKAISGLIPSMDKQNFTLTSGPSERAMSAGEEPRLALCEEPKYTDFLYLPYGLEGYFDYEQGMACARELNKPVFLDFKGHACSNCKEMEARVWSHPEVLKRLREEFVIIALYVDDRTKLPESEWVTSEVDGKVKKTIGKINADLQIDMFEVNSQPYYVIADHDGNALVEPMAHDLNIDRYISFLDRGIAAFKERSE
jgi:thiol:disulfide interchange protein DsbD